MPHAEAALPPTETPSPVPTPASAADAAPPPRTGLLRVLGLGLITGASDDDPSAIGTYAAVGARFGTSMLWAAPIMFPMMVTVVYLSSKLGQVAGKGLFEVIADRYPPIILRLALIGVLIGNVFEAGADIGGMAAALGLLAPIPAAWILLPLTIGLVALQVWGSYALIRKVFQWLALALLAYVPAALLSRPDPMAILRGLVPTVEWSREFLSLFVAIIGTTLSAYLYTWQSNVEVEEEIERGRVHLWQRRGASRQELAHSRRDIMSGMLFANMVMFFVILSTAALHNAVKTDIETAADAASALRPFAGRAAELLFATGIVAVGCLAVPVMTTGAAYDLCQTVGWEHGLYKKPHEAKRFYAVIAAFTAVATGLNLLGFNPMKALVWAGIVQGFSTPPLLIMMMLLTNDHRVMQNRVNTPFLNVMGWTTTGIALAATVALLVTSL
ncbi:MAG: divalent metal cation transporter [Burkholderiales bacterium]